MTIPWPGGFPQQGWQCPVCHRVYAPFCPACFVRGQKNMVTQKVTQPVPPQPEKSIYKVTICNPPTAETISVCGSSSTVVYKTIPNNWSYTSQ